MCKKAIITCGFPMSGKTSIYNSNYNQYSYFSVDSPSNDSLEYLNNLAKSGDNIYIDGRNPTIESRNFYIQFLKKYGYSIQCLWFPMPFEAILSLSYNISNFNNKQKFIDSCYSFNSRFEPPSQKEPFTVIEKVPFIPEITKYGNNKALFISVLGIFAKKSIRTKEFKPFNKFEIINSQFSQIVDVYRQEGYKIILTPNKMISYIDETEIISEIMNISKISKIPFTDIVFCEKNESKIGGTRVAYPDEIIKSCKKNKIDLENSIMVGNDRFEMALSIISGFKYYFNKDIFFGVPNYVKMVLEGKKNDSNY